MADEGLGSSEGFGGTGASRDAGTEPLPLTPSEPGQERTYLVNNDETKEPEIWTAAQVEQNQRFNRAMATTPRPLITPILIAINVAGVARAYPIRIVSYHHIVNDVVNGEPIVATY